MDSRQYRLDAVGGLTTFLTMGYIVVVNPAILKDSGIPFSAALTATVILASSMTLLMGLYAKLPFGVAPGMGVNAFFTYTLCLGQGVPWQHALGITFWAGVFFLLLSVWRVREAIAKAIPNHLRLAAAVGIGLFLMFLGLKGAKFITGSDATFVTRAPLSEESVLAAVGIFVTVLLLIRKSSLAMLAGIGVVTLLAALRGKITVPEQIFSPPDFSAFAALDILGSLKTAYIGAMFGIVFTDLFDSLSTFCGVAQASKLLDEDGNPKNLREGLITDAFATLLAGIFGTSSGTAYVESAAGIKAGARTGFASVVTGLLFLPCLFIGPVAGMIPGYATAPVLIVVGALMIGTVSEMKLLEADELCLEKLIPAALTLGTIPLTFSITQGIIVGFISHTLCYLAAGRWREIHPMMYALAGISVWLLVIS